MNTGNFWSADAKADLLALSRDAFMAKYPKVSGDAYRQRHAAESRLVEMAAPLTLSDDGLYHMQDFIYEAKSPVIPAGVERHINIGDTHGAFVEQTVWAAVLDFVRYFKPDQINCLGDMVDFYDVSRYTKNPNRRMVLGDEVEFARDVIFGELRKAAPKARIIWKQGNHEARLEKYLWSRAPELASLPGLDMRAIFRLDKLRINYMTDDLQVGDVQLTHGHMVRKHSGWTAKAMLDDGGMSVVHNHTHRLGAVYKTDRSGDYVAFENGCLCKLDPEFINGVPNWQHGFSCGWVMPSGRFHFQQIAIIDGKFIFDGRMFGADEQLDHCHP